LRRAGHGRRRYRHEFFVAEVHGRMLVLLGEKDYEPWLSGAAGMELLRPTAKDLLQR
jgi:putative SOS response-associated peptidase YedK